MSALAGKLTLARVTALTETDLGNSKRQALGAVQCIVAVTGSKRFPRLRFCMNQAPTCPLDDHTRVPPGTEESRER